MRNYSYSIIIPTRNQVELLQRCLDSIPIRNDVQVIIVDDNSDSTVVNFENYPGLKNENTEVIFTKEGRGAGYARNIGLRAATGKWIIFSDSDDFFNTEVLSQAMDEYLKSEYDILYFDVEMVEEDTMNVVPFSLEISKRIKGHEASDEEYFRYKVTYPWAKFIKKSLIDRFNIKFDEVVAGNDVMFSLISGHNASAVALVDMQIYVWVYRKKGNITSNLTKDAVLSKFAVAQRRYDYLKKNSILKYRNNLFTTYVFLFKKAGFSYFEAFRRVVKATPCRYLLYDIWNFIFFIVKKVFNRL